MKRKKFTKKRLAIFYLYFQNHPQYLPNKEDNDDEVHPHKMITTIIKATTVLISKNNNNKYFLPLHLSHQNE